MEEEVETRYVFIMMLAISDKEGVVIGTDTAISRRINVPLNLFRGAMERLMAPDGESNNHEHDGRRIIPSEGERGYQIVSYTIYRDMKDEEARREYMKGYMQEYRRKTKPSKQDSLPVNSVNSGKHMQMHAVPVTLPPSSDLKLKPKVENGWKKDIEDVVSSVSQFSAP